MISHTHGRLRDKRLWAMLAIIFSLLLALQLYYVSILYNQLKAITEQSKLSAVSSLKVSSFLVHGDCK